MLQVYLHKVPTILRTLLISSFSMESICFLADMAFIKVLGVIHASRVASKSVHCRILSRPEGIEKDLDGRSHVSKWSSFSLSQFRFCWTDVFKSLHLIVEPMAPLPWKWRRLGCSSPCCVVVRDWTTRWGTCRCAILSVIPLFSRISWISSAVAMVLCST